MAFRWTIMRCRARIRPALPAIALIASASSSAITVDCAAQRLRAGGVRADARRILPAGFVANAGQWRADVAYAARGDRMVVGVGRDALVLRFPSDHRSGARLTFRGAAAGCRLEGVGPRPEKLSFVLGDDATRWRHDVPSFDAVCYRGLYDGVDAILRKASDGRVHYDFVLRPGVDAQDIIIDGDAAGAFSIDANGDLLLALPSGVLRQSAPVAWEERDGTQRPVSCRFRLLGDRSFGFATGVRGAGTLIIDPGLSWSTYYGGEQDDYATDVALDAVGDAIVVGGTWSLGLFTRPGAFDRTHNGSEDAFVAHVSQSGQLRYATFLGGSADERPFGVAVDASGAAVLTGRTRSTDFPTTAGAFDRTANAGDDVFVARLALSSQGLLQSTYIGGSFNEQGNGLAIAADGSVIVVGTSTSPDYPTTPSSLQPAPSSRRDGFVTKLAPTGSALTYSTFLGGSRDETCSAVVVDRFGLATVAGQTLSADYPTTPAAHSRTLSGGADGFVSRLDSSGSALLFSTYFGGNDAEWLEALAIGPSGALTVAGFTRSSSGLATPGAFDTAANGSTDAFVAQLNAVGSAVNFATYLGGGGPDFVWGLAVTSRDEAVVVGHSASTNFPTTFGSFQPALSSFALPLRGDGFVSKLARSGDRLLYSTFLGAPDGTDSLQGVVLDALDGAVVVGNSDGAAFPVTAGGFQQVHRGEFDATIAALDLLPSGATASGWSSPGCTGPLPIGVDAAPLVGSTFAVTCGNAPPSGLGIAHFGALGLATPLLAGGIAIWVDPASAWMLAIPVRSDPIGGAEVAVRVPNRAGLVGVGFAAQFAWWVSGGPPCPPLGLAASNGMRVILQ